MRISSTVTDEDVDEEEDVLTKPGGLSASSLRTSVRSCSPSRWEPRAPRCVLCSPLGRGSWYGADRIRYSVRAVLSTEIRLVPTCHIAENVT